MMPEGKGGQVSPGLILVTITGFPIRSGMTMEWVLDIRRHYAYPEKIIVGLLVFLSYWGLPAS